jgi:hypothetical protein
LRPRLVALRHRLILAFGRTGCAFDAKVPGAGHLLLRSQLPSGQTKRNQGNRCDDRSHDLSLREGSLWSKLKRSVDGSTRRALLLCYIRVMYWLYVRNLRQAKAIAELLRPQTLNEMLEKYDAEQELELS